MEKLKTKRRVYKPIRFGEGMQPGTVEWKLNQRRLRAERREDDHQWTELEAKREAESKSFKREAESKSFSGRLAALINRFKVWFHLPWALVGPNIDGNVGSCLNASLSNGSNGAIRPGFDLCSCTAEVLAKVLRFNAIEGVQEGAEKPVAA